MKKEPISFQDLSQKTEQDPMIGRIEQVITNYKVKQKTIANIIGVPASNISFFLSGKKNQVKFDSEKLDKLLAHFPTLSKKWIYFGEGNLEEKKYVHVDSMKMVKVVYIAEFASASFNIAIKPVETTDLCYTELIRIPGVEYNNRMSISIKGRSMEPTIMEGAIVLLKLIDKGDWRFLNGGVYIFDYDDHLVCKRLVDNDFENGYFMIYSDNPNDGKTKLLVEDTRNICKVEHIIYSPVI